MHHQISEMSTKANLKCSILVETGQIPIDNLKKISKFSVENLSDIYIEKTCY